MKWLALLALTLYGFLVFPGHTYLQSDTQIYVPMFDRIGDPSLFERELVAQRQHVSLTVYDEIAIGAKKLFGLDYQHSLAGVQIACRFAGLYGLYLIGTAIGLSEAMALLVPVLAGFGAFISGPAVITFEYEPVPRGFSVLLAFLGIGLAMHGRAIPAACAGAVAFLFHAPAVIPFLIPFVWIQIRDKQYRAMGLLGAAVVVAMGFTWMQAGSVEPQQFFSRIDPDWEKLQRMRAGYNWLSTWRAWQYQEFALHGLIVSLATWRLWKFLSSQNRTLIVGLTWIGLLSLPLAWVLSEEMRWLLMSQVQPARSVLFTVELSLALAACAGLIAVREGRLWEAGLWFAPGMFTAMNKYMANTASYQADRFYCAAVLVGAAILVAWGQRRWRNAGFAAAPVAVAMLAGWLFLDVTKQRNYDAIHHAELDDVAAWTRANTPRNAMFQLPELSRSLVAGIFRVKAQRALFVDWKIGGQVNYSRDLAMEWWRRMQIADRKDKPLESWTEEGVDFLVLKAATVFAGREPLYRNAKYAVYALR
jgi:hypothetical protein